MSPDRRLIDQELDRIERMLIRCAEADKASRKQRRAEADQFYEKLKILREMALPQKSGFTVGKKSVP